mmetsp:Transcript_14001/g.16683  ORF Transcript_14001/g.16683 Transcript_14001/m.16683 type:complete len:460 (+) Transcript_14001:30-1409(+)
MAAFETETVVDPIVIDGSILEGGGQVIRSALSLAFLSERPLILHSIRAGRADRGGGGLKPQHLESVRIAATLSGKKLTHDVKGSSDLICETQPIMQDNSENGGGAEEQSNVVVIADTGTAGAVTLILQAALPPLVFAAKRNTEIRLLGGTNVDFSPPIDHFELVILPLLKKMGIDIDYNLIKRGFVPKGGGEVSICAQLNRDNSSLKEKEEEGKERTGSLKPIQLIEQGEVIKIVGNIVFTSGFNENIINEFMEILQMKLNKMFSVPLNNASIILNLNADMINHSNTSNDNQVAASSSTPTITDKNNSSDPQIIEDTKNQKGNLSKKSFKKNKKKQLGNVSVQLALHTSTECILSCNYLRTQSKIDNSWISKYIDKLLNDISFLLMNKICVDEHTADQLIIWMSLAKGTSKIITPKQSQQTSQHLETVIHFAKELTGAMFKTTELESGLLIECNGIGLC